MAEIRPYRYEDEDQWVRCRALAFLDTAFYDDVVRKKPTYTHPAIELVAEQDGQIVGFLDIEREMHPATVCSKRPGLGGMLWNIGVHPDCRRQGIAAALLAKATDLARQCRLVRLEAWTRDDEWVNAWYEAQGFIQVAAYLHVWLAGTTEGLITSNLPGLHPVMTFAHYHGDRPDHLRGLCQRAHECRLYELRLDESS